MGKNVVRLPSNWDARRKAKCQPTRSQRGRHQLSVLKLVQLQLPPAVLTKLLQDHPQNWVQLPRRDGTVLVQTQQSQDLPRLSKMLHWAQATPVLESSQPHQQTWASCSQPQHLTWASCSLPQHQAKGLLLHHHPWVQSPGAQQLIIQLLKQPWVQIPAPEPR